MLQPRGRHSTHPPASPPAAGSSGRRERARMPLWHQPATRLQGQAAGHGQTAGQNTGQGNLQCCQAAWPIHVCHPTPAQLPVGLAHPGFNFSLLPVRPVMQPSSSARTTCSRDGQQRRHQQRAVLLASGSGWRVLGLLPGCCLAAVALDGCAHRHVAWGIQWGWCQPPQPSFYHHLPFIPAMHRRTFEVSTSPLPVQSTTSTTLGRPSVVTRSPAAPGSTPVCEGREGVRLSCAAVERSTGPRSCAAPQSAPGSPGRGGGQPVGLLALLSSRAPAKPAFDATALCYCPSISPVSKMATTVPRPSYVGCSCHGRAAGREAGD